MRFFLGLVLSLGLVLGVRAQTQNEVVFGDPQPEPGTSIRDNIDVGSATIFNPDAAAKVLAATVCAASDCDVSARDFYAIIHVLRWSDPKAPDNTQTVEAQNWYVYHVGSWWNTGGAWTQDKFTDAKRLYGAHHIYFLYVHLNRASTSKRYKARYEFQITKKTAANVQDVFLLAQLLATPGPAPAAPPPPQNLWGGRRVEIGLVPSDIQIDPRYVTDTSVSNRGDELSKAETFNNEGNHYWDVSVAVPLKKISDLKFDSTNGTVTPSKISTTNAFGLLDVYLPPVDLAGKSYNYIPHPIAGVALTGQPLHKVLVGGAIGLHYAEFYAGALFVKQQQLTGLQTGSPATPPQVAAASHFSYKTQFNVGINLPVRAMIDALKNTKNKSQ